MNNLFFNLIKKRVGAASFYLPGAESESNDSAPKDNEQTVEGWRTQEP
jgi:hypothetical protein